jgi:inorganic pyrophosphatase
MNKFSLIILIAIIFLVSCDKKGIGDVARFNKNGDVHLVVEIPAGSLIKYQYDPSLKGFKSKVENGINETINFIPYPFNLGFIPPYIEKNKTEVIILSESFSTGTLLEGKIIGALEYELNSKLNIIYVAIPLNYKYNILKQQDLSIASETNSKLIQIFKSILFESKGYKFTNKIFSSSEASAKIHK